MPTSAEFLAMKNATYWAWDNTDLGYYVYMPKNENDKGHYYGEPYFTPTGSYSKEEAVLFFPSAGYGDGKSLDTTGIRGRYWLSDLDSSDSNKANFIDFRSGNLVSNVYWRYIGMSIRPVHD